MCVLETDNFNVTHHKTKEDASTMLLMLKVDFWQKLATTVFIEYVRWLMGLMCFVVEYLKWVNMHSPCVSIGYIVVLPCIDTWTRVDLRTKAFSVPPQKVCNLFCKLHMYRWRGSATGRALDLRSVGRGFKSHLRQCCITTLGKLFTPMCLCHQAV